MFNRLIRYSIMIGKGRAIELIDKKITQLESIREPRNPDNLYDETYSQIYYGTEELLAQLFSKEKVELFTKLPFGRRSRTIPTKSSFCLYLVWAIFTPP